MNQLNILIVDDNRDMADGLGGILEDEGYQVTLAYNWRDGIRAFNAGRFDVVLDFRRPVTYGLKAYLELKQRGHIVKTVIVTGFADEESGSVDVLRSTAVTGCLFKPFRPENMLRAVERIMARQDGLPGRGDCLGI